MIDFTLNDNSINYILEDGAIDYTLNAVSEPELSFRILEDGDFRTTEDGDFRILE